MPKITKAQIDSLNSKCKNDWKFDWQYYLNYGEKTFIKSIPLDAENYLEYALRYNYKNQISIHISKFNHKENETFAVTSGMGKSIVLDETQVKRKNVNDLIEFTKTLNDEQLIEINKNTKVSKSNGLILQSEEF